MAETVDKVLEQAFAASHEEALAAKARRISASDNVSEQTKLLFLEEKIKVGTREAAAMQRMDTSKLAEQILQQRSAKNQPDA